MPHPASTSPKRSSVAEQRSCSSSALSQRLHLWSNAPQPAHIDKPVRADNLCTAARTREEHRGQGPSAESLPQSHKERRENLEQCGAPVPDEKALFRACL